MSLLKLPKKDGICVGEHDPFDDYVDVFFQRATGQLPEMESSKACAAMIKEHVTEHDKILDIGCGTGHTYRSLKKQIKKNFSYTGVDYFEDMLEKARQAWSNEDNTKFLMGSIFDLPVNNEEHDIVLCSNLLMHLPSIVQPLRQLIRATKKKLIMRTTIDERSWVIKEVFNNSWFKYAKNTAEDEFEDDGTPRLYSLHNIYSIDYFSAIIRRYAGDVRVDYIDDVSFVPKNIETSAEAVQLPNSTRMLNGRQIYGNMFFLPYKFVVVHIS
jgi:ubiquinone/menaquinone biosynthesis C-methylase UbiE